MKPSAIPGIPSKIIMRGLQVLNIGLHYLEDLSCPEVEERLPYPPVFIIGSPRSGSTLLLQVLLNRYKFTHITNMHCLLHGAVSLVERWGGPSWKKGGLKKYRSWYGKSKGLWAPSECGPFWYRWFPRTPAYVKAEDVPEGKLKSLRRVVAALGKAGGQPVLFKNLYCSIRLTALAKAFPEALFIVVKRDVLRIGLSLLDMRKNVNGNYDDWISVPPPEFERLKGLRPPLQVMGQVKAIYRHIEANSRKIGEDRFIRVAYEDFCHDTHMELVRIERFLAAHGIRLEKRGQVPAGFAKPAEGYTVRNTRLFKDLEKASRLDLEDILGETKRPPRATGRQAGRFQTGW